MVSDSMEENGQSPEELKGSRHEQIDKSLSMIMHYEEVQRLADVLKRVSTQMENDDKISEEKK